MDRDEASAYVAVYKEWFAAVAQMDQTSRRVAELLAEHPEYTTLAELVASDGDPRTALLAETGAIEFRRVSEIEASMISSGWLDEDERTVPAIDSKGAER